MVTEEEVLEFHTRLCDKARSILPEKMQGYNRGAEDVLSNMRMGSVLGIVDYDTQGVLLRMADKFKRMVSYGKNPLLVRANEEETIEDTCMDMINYVNHFLMIYNDIRQGNKSALRELQIKKELMQ